MRALRKDDEDLVTRILIAIEFSSDVTDLVDALADALESAGKAGTDAAMLQLSLDDAGILDVANESAIQFAKDSAAEIVGKKWIDGELVDNPNVEWRIDEATRDMLRDQISQGMEEGWSNDRLADAIDDSYAFSEDRAEVIARTETAFADINGNLAVYRESGVAEKQWLTAPDCCDECEELDGIVVGIDDAFPNGGGDGSPLHPNCRCDVLPVIEDNSQED